MRIRIYYDDTDAQGIVYHANYLKFCERARSELFFQAGIDIFSQQSYFVISDINAKFLAPAKLGDEIEVKTKLIATKTASAWLSQEIFKGEELLFRAEVKAVHISFAKPAKMPENIINFFNTLK